MSPLAGPACEGCGTYECPWDKPPYPNTMIIGLGLETSHHIVLESNGDVNFMDDPLGDPLFTLRPEQSHVPGILRWLANHLQYHSPDEGQCECQLIERIPGSLESLEAKKEGKPVSWWATMHTDADPKHTTPREQCEQCQEMIKVFGKMPPKGEIRRSKKYAYRGMTSDDPYIPGEHEDDEQEPPQKKPAQQAELSPELAEWAKK